MKKILILLVCFAFPFISFAQESVTSPDLLDLTLYVRQGCSHCAKVEAFITKYNIVDNVVIRDTFENQGYTDELNGYFDKFKIEEGARGVPFLVINGIEYKAGDTPIIEYLTDTFNITVVDEKYQTSTSDMIFLGIGGLFLFAVLGYGIYTIVKKK